MKPIVVDASIAASWLFDDEDDPAAERILDTLALRPGLVPAIWHYEIRNILLVAYRRGRITVEGLWLRVLSLVHLPLETDDAADLDRVTRLALAHERSYHDALYLELAIRRGAALSSFDRRLVAAAEREALEVLPRGHRPGAT